jgi:hypothetical protein
MGNNKIKIVATTAILLGLVFVGYLITRQELSKNNAYQATVTTDPDTGETIINDTNQAETTGDDAYITLQGSDKLYNAMSDQQFRLLRDLIGQYARVNIKPGLQTVKVLPDTVTINADETHGSFKMKITEPQTDLNATIDIFRAEAVRIVITNPTKPGKPYDSGLVYVSDTQSQDYGGDGTPPEESGD